MSLPKTLLLSLAATLVLLAAPARAQQGGPAAPAEPPKKLDAAGKALGDKTDALAQQAAALVEEYKKAISARIDKMSAENPQLGRLHKAGLFTLASVTTGVSADPLQGLPDIRKAYEDLDQTAALTLTTFGGVATQSAEQQAVQFLKKIIAAQTSFREDDKDGNGVLDYAQGFADLQQAGALQLPQPKKADGTLVTGGYRFRILAADLLTWSGDAAPTGGDVANVYFYTDQTGIIRAEKGKPAGPTSPPWKAE
jgi:hypothetical protein